MRDALARRVARLAAGIVLVLGAIQLACWALSPRGASGVTATGILASTWLAAGLVYGGARLVLWLWLPRRERGIALSMPLELASLAVPAIGVGLLAPLTLHLPIVVGVGGASVFEWWARTSIYLVGVAHLVFAALVGVRATQLVRGVEPMRWPRIVGICTLVASIPWIILFPVPIVVGLTGLLLAPIALVMDRVAARAVAEREALAAWDHVPVAIVVHGGRAAA